MDMLADGRLDVAPLMTHSFAATEFPTAYRMASHYEGGVIKTIIRWNTTGDVHAPSVNGLGGSLGAGGVSVVGAAAGGIVTCRRSRRGRSSGQWTTKARRRPRADDPGVDVGIVL